MLRLATASAAPRHRLLYRLAVEPVAERRALLSGLRDKAAHVSPKYFYDALGCALYSAICELPEYYLTAVERAIYDEHRTDMARAIGHVRNFVDLGAGDCGKGERWLESLAVSRYLAVDLAADAIDRGLSRLTPRFPGVEMVGVVADFTYGLDLRADLGDSPTLFFYPGSSIGNFTPGEARTFLRSIREHCAARGSGLLIGVDTKKATARLETAYDDRLGVTAAFNRNVLHHVNRILGSDFDVAQYAHRALYDARAGRIEMHLVATSAQTVMLDGEPRFFAAGEHIYTESSYKYAPAEFVALLEGAGFPAVRVWQDAHGEFAVYHAAAK